MLFADDTNLFAFHRDLNTLAQLVNRELELINTYFKVYKLSLNLDKTVFMVFISERKKHDANVVENRILLKDKPVQQVSTTNFLDKISRGVHQWTFKLGWPYSSSK